MRPSTEIKTTVCPPPLPGKLKGQVSAPNLAVLISSELIQELVDGNAGLTKDGLQSFRRNCLVLRNSEPYLAPGQPNVRTMLPNHLESHSTQGLDGVLTGNIPRELHAVATTGSARKCKRIERGASRAPSGRPLPR